MHTDFFDMIDMRIGLKGVKGLIQVSFRFQEDRIMPGEVNELRGSCLRFRLRKLSLEPLNPILVSKGIDRR